MAEQDAVLAGGPPTYAPVGGAGPVDGIGRLLAAVGLSVHLAAAGLLPEGHTDYVVDQGAEVGRPSRLVCGCDVRSGRAVATSVGGSVVAVARGEVRPPG